MNAQQILINEKFSEIVDAELGKKDIFNRSELLGAMKESYNLAIETVATEAQEVQVIGIEAGIKINRTMINKEEILKLKI